MGTPHRKNVWTPEEVEKLKALVARHGDTPDGRRNVAVGLRRSLDSVKNKLAELRQREAA